MNGWKISKSPIPSDIIWENIGKGVVRRKVKELVAILLIVLVSIVFMSPFTLVDVLKPLADDFERKVLSKTALKSILSEMLAPLMIMVFNMVLIPILIDLAATFTDH